MDYPSPFKADNSRSDNAPELFERASECASFREKVEVCPDLNIGALIGESLLEVEIAGKSKANVFISCHTHGISIADKCGRVMDLIPFQNVIKLSCTVRLGQIIPGILPASKKSTLLCLEYINAKNGDRIFLNMVPVGSDSPFIDGEAAIRKFIAICERAKIESTESLPEKAQIEQALYLEIDTRKKHAKKAIFAIRIFLVFFIFLLIFPALFGIEPSGFVASVWCVLFGICVFAIFMAMLFLIGVFISKYFK